jgi:hypothetical protein
MNYFNEQSDEPLYELVAKELAHSPRQGLLIKCMAKCEGIESKAKAMYIKVRVAEMKLEIKQRVKKEEADQKKKAEEDFKLDEVVTDYSWLFIFVFVVIIGLVIAMFN